MRLESFECLNLLQKWHIFKMIHEIRIFWMSESFANVTNIKKIHQFESIECLNLLQRWKLLKNSLDLNLLNVWIFCRCDKYSNDSQKLNLLNVWIFCKHEHIQEIRQSLIFWMSESLANMTNIQKIHETWIFGMSESLANLTYIKKWFKGFESLNVWILCKCEKFTRDSPELNLPKKWSNSADLNLSNVWIFCKKIEVSRIFKTFERFGKFELNLWMFESFTNVKKFQKIHQFESFECLNLLQMWKLFPRFTRFESFECLNLLQK